VPPITFQGNCHAKPKATLRKFQRFGDADRISGNINDLDVDDCGKGSGYDLLLRLLAASRSA
jgi:hypothetical protein